MKNVMIGVAFVYFLLVANFYNESHGFTKFYNEYYPYWKVTPMLFLISFVLVHGGGMSKQASYYAAAGLALGTVGDYLIGISNEGIVTGAIAFGMGHFTYMSMFLNRSTIIYWPCLITMLLFGAVVGHINLMPLIGEQPISVGIMTFYSLILTANSVIAMSQYIHSNKKDNLKALQSRLLGFVLFFTSDTLLIFNHTGRGVPLAEVWILASYFSAQFFILNSFVEEAAPLAVGAHKKKV